MNLEFHTAIVLLLGLIILGALFSLWNGLITIRKARKVAYFRLRRRQSSAGWWRIMFALFLVAFAILLGHFGEPVTYHFFPPSPSPTLTPSITLTPTISLTPTITLTPSITPTPQFSYTPTITPTAFLPEDVQAQFVSIVTPNPDAVFSPLTFSLKVNNYQAVNPQTVFENPITRVYATYSYNHMTDGVQWTAIWYQNGEVKQYRTISWDSGTGGYGQEELDLPPEEWLPGIYQLIFFIGTDWKVLGEFRVMGEPPTATATQIPSPTPTPTQTPTQSPTLTPTRTTTAASTP
jgi:hypothetical protein